MGSTTLLAAILCIATSAMADSAPDTDAPTNADDLARCQDAARRQDGDAVIDLCSRVIDHKPVPQPADAPVYAARGQAYLAKQDFDHALADLGQAITLQPDLASLYALRSQVYSNQGDFQNAVDDLNQALQRAPDDAEYLSARGDAYGALGDSERAVADHVQAIRFSPCDASQGDATACGQFHAGIAAYLGGDDPQAIQALEQAAQSANADPRTLLWLTLARLRNRQDATTPLNDAAAALDLNAWPGPMIRYYQGRVSPTSVQQAAMDPDPATAQRQGCDLDFYVAARALVDGRAAGAAAGFAIARDACPSSVIEFEAAKTEAIIAAQPVSADMAQGMNACSSVSDAGTDPASIVEFCADAAKDPGMPDAWQFDALVMSARARHQLGDDGNAVADLDRALALRPGAADATRRRGLYRLAKGDAEGGFADLDQAIALNPDSIETRLSRGWAYADQGDWPKAAADFGDAIDRDPTSPRAYLMRGAAALLSGDVDGARGDFGSAIDAAAPQGAPYAVLWLALANRSQHVTDDAKLATGIAALDLGQWPGPVLRFLKGEIDADALAAAAGDPAADPSAACAAAFYPAAAALLDGQKDTAKPGLKQARAMCGEGSIESDAANLALKRM